MGSGQLREKASAPSQPGWNLCSRSKERSSISLPSDQHSGYPHPSDPALRRTFCSLPAKEKAIISLKCGAAAGGR